MILLSSFVFLRHTILLVSYTPPPFGMNNFTPCFSRNPLTKILLLSSHERWWFFFSLFYYRSHWIHIKILTRIWFSVNDQNLSFISFMKLCSSFFKWEIFHIQKFDKNIMRFHCQFQHLLIPIRPPCLSQFYYSWIFFVKLISCPLLILWVSPPLN